MKIKIKGALISNDLKWIYDHFEMDSTCPRDIQSQLDAAKGKNVEVEINSPGGDVFAGAEIYTSLKEYSGDTIGKVVGVAASAASLAAMGVQKLLISPAAQIMIHNVWSWASGDYKTFEHEADMLKNWSKSIANTYMLKTGLSQEELLDMMSEETWFTAQDAVKYKFADEIMFDAAPQLVAIQGNGMLPPEVIEKMMAQKQNAKEGLEDETIEDPRQAPVDLYNKLYENLERRAVLC